MKVRKKTKIITDYLLLIQTIRKEYALVTKENDALQIRLQKLENYKNQQQLIEYNKKQ